MKEQYNGTEIAIIGMSGQFPGSDSVNEFWETLKSGKEEITFFSKEELIKEGTPEAMIDHENFVPANGYMKSKQLFDAPFFGYLPAEAKLLDPQTRRFHEECWKALEDSGYDPFNFGGKIGLFAGGTPNMNWENYAMLSNTGEVNEYSAKVYRNIAFMCSRTAFLLNLKGPVAYVNTACSTSLVAIQKACMSLLLGECKMAISGGVSIRNFSRRGYLFEEGMIASKDGHCSAYDKDASGTIGGDGVGVVVLKKLKDAIADNDNIHAIIKGSGVNNDGNDKISFTSPSVDGQSNAIIKAIQMARIKPESISYVEGHGTGTNMGDPIELRALTRAFNSSEKQFCGLGSVKTNIGHLNEAAGVAGVIKTVLALKHRQIPPSLNFSEPNPAMEIENSPFYVTDKLTDWQASGPLRAGVSSFGIGGTNVHVILEEAPKTGKRSAKEGHYVLMTSAKTKSALKRNQKQLVEFLAENPDQNIEDVAYTLSVGRHAFDYRSYLIVDANGNVQFENTSSTHKAINGKIKTCFLFTGQGAQYSNMYKELYDNDTRFQMILDTCFESAEKHSGVNFKSIVFGNNDQIHQTQFTQPLLFIFEYTMAKRLMETGIKPDQLVGHSIGEYAAACIAGVFCFEAALKLVLKRGELMQSTEAGSMLSIALRESEVQELIKEYSFVDVAAVNGPESTVLSGKTEILDSIIAVLTEKGIRFKELKTSHAFHSFLMDPILDEFAQEFDGVTFNKPEIEIISNLTGATVSDEMCKPEYWTNQLRKAVKFDSCASAVLDTEAAIFVEVGPGNTLVSLIRSNENFDASKHRMIHTVRRPNEEVNDYVKFLTSLASAWTNGLEMDNINQLDEKSCRRISLPTYSFDPYEFPADVDAFELIQGLSGGQNDIEDWFYTEEWSFVNPTKQVKISLDKSLLFSGDSSGQIQEQLNSISKDVVQIGAEETIHGEADLVCLDSRAMSSDKVRDLLSGIAENLSGTFQLVLVTSDTNSFDGTNQVSPENAQFLPLLKTFEIERPGVRAYSLEINEDEQITEECIQSILAEEEKHDFLIKNGMLFKRRMAKLRLSDEQQEFIVSGSTYLIYGGLGNLSFVLAKKLLNDFNCTVAVFGRSKIDESGSGDKVRLKRFKELKAMKGNLLYLSEDAWNKENIAQRTGEIENTYGKVRGVFQTSGLTTGDSFQSLSALSPEHFEAQNNPKKNAFEALKNVFADKELDFYVTSSSISAQLGGLNYGAYASANLLMDKSLERSKQDQRLKNWYSIQLDGLNFLGGNEGIDKSKIWEVFEKAYALRDHTIISISCSDLNERMFSIRIQETKEVSGEELASIEASIAGDFENETQKKLMSLWLHFFGVQEISISDDFFELGGDSLKALDMTSLIFKHLNVQVPIGEFFSRATIEKLAEYIEVQTWLKSNETVEKTNTTEITI